ncbi:tyrosine-type recombinase/integrase [Bdellovibrionota bacterium FG-2]
MSKRKKWRVTSDKFLTLTQIERLNAYLTDRRDLALARSKNLQGIRDFYLLRTLLETGLRVFELCALENSDFAGLRLAVRHGKGDVPRTVLLTRTTANMLKEWLLIKERLGSESAPTAPLFPSRYSTAYTTRGVQKRVKLIFAVLSFPTQLSTHCLRHTYCSLLLASGKVGLGTVRDNLGHHSISVTNLYAHAVGTLDNLDLYAPPSSDKCEKAELHAIVPAKKPKSVVSAFLRNTNFKRGDGDD